MAESTERRILRAITKYLGLMVKSTDDQKYLAAIMAHLKIESFGFTKTTEATRYSAARLFEVFPKYFKSVEEASELIKLGDDKVFNRVYGNRMGNGNEATGDGFRYIGRGYLQITGLDNYKAVKNQFKFDVVAFPSTLITLDKDGLVSAWWLSKKAGFREACLRSEDMIACTKIVNGGVNALKYRKEAYDYYRKLLVELISERFFNG